VEKNVATKPETALKIGELAQRTGITRQALHQYVLLGLLTPNATTSGKHRLFRLADIERVRLIRNLCASGYTLCEIRKTFLHDR
jgi:DNA-binding transcriptional MerR regulator